MAKRIRKSTKYTMYDKIKYNTDVVCSAVCRAPPPHHPQLRGAGGGESAVLSRAANELENNLRPHISC